MELDNKINDYVAYLSSYQNVEPDLVFGSEGELSDDNVCDKKDDREIERENRVKVTQPASEPPEDDLEEWLDNILDD